ncbi:MAG: trypsin-like peptidase domain-containing protein [Verrucomicrobiia bacterium]
MGFYRWGELRQALALVIWFRSVFAGLLLLGLGSVAEGVERVGADLRRSVVRIQVTSQQMDYRVPWNPGQLGRGVGTGFVIEGERLMTNAHVVSNARLITVQKDGDPRRFTAKVEHVAHDCDLALLKVVEEGFFEGMEALEFGGIPAMESTVTVYGFPLGGDRMSVTRGVVSRIDFQVYSHSAIDAHLVIQIDAAINPGNSGGPVLQEGKVVGVAFQGFTGDVAQNVGYMIPTPVTERFLKDVEDGSYDRYVDLAIDYFPLQNAGMRRALGLADDDTGVMVGHVTSAGSSHGRLEVGDVLLSIDGLPIGSDGTVVLDGERVEMPEIVERKFYGDEVVFELLRAGEKKEVTVRLKPVWPYLIQGNLYDVRPRYVMYGGLVFQPVTRNFMEAFKPTDLRLRYLYDSFVREEIFVERPELVVLSEILPDPINTFLLPLRMNVVDKINGERVRRLEDVPRALEKNGERAVIELLGVGRPIVMSRAAVEEAMPRIRSRYQVLSDQHLEGSFVPKDL